MITLSKEARLVAWALIQALALSPLVPLLPAAHAAAGRADTLKVEAALEGAAKAGLEERLGAAAPAGAGGGAPPASFGEAKRGGAGLEEGRRLDEVVDLAAVPVIYPGAVPQDLSVAKTVLITADAGKGTRFAASGGGELKVVAPVGGLPAGVRSKLAARDLGWPVISVVGYRKEEVMAAFKAHMPEVLFVEAENPTGGTGYAIYHGAAVKGLRESGALVIATMGDQPLYDRPVLEAVEQTFRASAADLVIATAIFPDPKGKGRIVRDLQGKILGILEQKDIEKGATLGGHSKEHLLAIPEGNLSIYAMPAKRLFDLLAGTRNNNAQSQFYLPDIVKMVLDRGGRVEAVRIDPEKAPDLTTAEDLAAVEAILAKQGAGLEEPYEISSPMAPPPQGEAVLSMADFDPVHVRQLVEAGRRVVLRTELDRVGERLWDKQSHRQEMQDLYRLVYDLSEGRGSLTAGEIGRVAEGLNHPSQAVAAAARDVIVKARIHGPAEIVRDLVQAHRQRTAGAPAGPYAEHYLKDALTARIDRTHKMELGSPEVPVFAGEMTEQRMRAIHEQLKRWVDPKNRLSLLTGSGQRMAAPVGLVEAGLREGGFPPQELMVDIGSQPHDVVKVLFGLVAKRFIESMPEWRREMGRDEREKQMPRRWSVAVGMDPRSTGPAILQVAARIFRKMGVEVKFIGIASAPEAAARALLSDPEENLLACYEITPSHIPQGFQGTKLMLWTGQILPWSKAEAFNDQIRAAAQNFDEVRQVIEWLGEPSLGGEVDRILRQMPQEYADSKRRYHRYLMQLFAGSSKTGPELEEEISRLAEELKRLGVTAVIDANGGARITDLPLYDRLFGGTLVIGADAAEFAHSLPPGEISARALAEFAKRVVPAFDEKNLSLILVNPDPDGDRKGIVYRAPDGEFLYLDPQAGYLLDALNHVLSAEEAGVPGVGVVGNEATTIVAKILADRLTFKFRVTETGEANVVQGMNRLLKELLQQHQGDRSKVSVLGGEGSAAATIAGDVQVRDMIQGVVSIVNFARKPERVRRLIELLVDDPTEKERLLAALDKEWYRPGRLPYLLYHIVHEVLPPMRNTDPGYDTEVHQGVAVQDQRSFKDTADRLLAPEGEWVRRFREETAQVLGVSPDRIRVSEPINNVEDVQLPGAGNRTLPDGRTIHDGGYEIQVFYRDPAGREHLLYKLEFRRSKTQVGDTRRMVFAAMTFLPRAQAEPLLDRLYERVYSFWLAFLNDLEAEELMGHLRGDVGPVRPALIQELAGSLERLLSTTRQARQIRVERLADPAKPTYSRVDAENIREQDAAASGAMGRLSALLKQMEGPIAALSALAQEIQGGTALSPDQQGRLSAALDDLQAPLQVAIPLPSKQRIDIASAMAQRVVAGSLRWKVGRLLEGMDPASAPSVLERVDRLRRVVADLLEFASRGTAAADPRQGVAFSNLVNAKILLSQEPVSLRAAGLEERSAGPAGEWTAPVWRRALAGAADLLNRIGEELGEDSVQEETAVDPARLAPFLEGRLKGPLPSAEAAGVLSEFSDIFGWNPPQIRAQLARAARLIDRFDEEHGAGVQPLYFGWAPGRWMLFGHGDYNGFDEFGGTLQAGLMVIARPRGDGRVAAASTNPEFAKGSFDAADGFQPANNWVDLVQGSVRYAQDRFPGERFRGMDLLVDSEIPGRGQSSSTAVSVATMMAALSLNGKPLNPEELVVWCAEAERWGARTQGGQADQSFMLLSRRGQVMEVGPDLGRRRYFPFPATHRLVVLDSRVALDKTGDTRISFNQQSAQTQLLGFGLLKGRFLARFPGQAEKILPVRNLRALYESAHELGLEINLRAIARNLPKAISSGNIAQEIRKRYRKAQKARPNLKISAPDAAALLAELYPDVPAPPGGWRIKPRIEHLFLLWDLAGRVELALDNGDMETFGAIMVEEMESLDRNYEVINKEHAGLLASYAQEAGAAGVTGQGDFGGNVLALVSTSAADDLIDYLFDKYYSRRDFKNREELSRVPPAVLVAGSSRAAGPIRPRMPRAGDSLPAKILQAVDGEALPRWVERLSPEQDPALFRLYGWLRDLPPAELAELLDRYARIYPAFIRHLEQSRRKMAAGKIGARKEVTLKPDRTWVSRMDQEIQTDFNRLVAGEPEAAGEFPFVTVVGEEIPGPTKSVGGDPFSARWVVFRDPLDGTSNYISEDSRKNRRYLSLLRLDYRGEDGVLRPLLSAAVAPEFLDGGPVWLVAGLGIDGVLVNGEVRKTPAAERSPPETVAGINEDLLQGNHPDYRLYHDTAGRLGLKVLAAQDNMGLFQIPLGQVDLFLAPPQAPWDSRPPEHLVQAFGGSVTTPRGLPYPLDKPTLETTLKERGEHLLFASSPAVAQPVINAYQTAQARVEIMARLSTARMMIQQAATADEAASYQGDLLKAEQDLGRLEQQPPPAGAGLEEAALAVEAPSVVDANHGLILAGEALTFLEMLPFIRPVDGRQVPVVAIAEDEDQQKRVLARAGTLGLSVSVINAKDSFGGNVIAAARDARARLADQGFDYRIAILLSQLTEVVGFLGVLGPESYAKAAEGFLREQMGNYL